MYLSRPYHFLGTQARADVLAQVKDNPEAIQRLADSKVECYNAISGDFGTLTERVLSELMSEEALTPQDVSAILYTRVCEANSEGLDRSVDEALANLELVSTPLIQMGGGQCANGALLLMQAEALLAKDPESTILIVEANIVPDTQDRNYLDNTVILSDGVVAYTVSKKQNAYKVLATSIEFDHKVRGLQYSGNPAGAIIAFKKTQQLLVRCMESITDKTQRTMADFVKVFTSNTLNTVEQIRESFGLQESKIYAGNIPKHGHFFGAELFYNFAEFDQSCEWAKDVAVLLFHCGYSAFGFSAIQKLG